MEAYSSRFYDQYFVGVEGDAAFYVDAARRAGSPVLELGCGTGRVLLPIGLAGIRACGLDASDELLAVAREKLAACPPEVQERVELARGDMRAFSLDQRFRLVVVPYRAFQHLLTPIDQEEALTCIRDHLVDGGQLIINLFDPLRELVDEGFRSGLRRDTDFVDAPTGNQVVVWYSRQYDPETQLLEQELIYEEVDRNGRSVGRTYGRLVLRCAARYEVQYLLELSGFETEALYGDFQGSPYPGYGEQVWVARKV